jgi:hypothetical protein
MCIDGLYESKRAYQKDKIQRNISENDKTSWFVSLYSSISHIVLSFKKEHDTADFNLNIVSFVDISGLMSEWAFYNV